MTEHSGCLGSCQPVAGQSRVTLHQALINPANTEADKTQKRGAHQVGDAQAVDGRATAQRCPVARDAAPSPSRLGTDGTRRRSLTTALHGLHFVGGRLNISASPMFGSRTTSGARKQSSIPMAPSPGGTNGSQPRDMSNPRAAVWRRMTRSCASPTRPSNLRSPGMPGMQADKSPKWGRCLPSNSLRMVEDGLKGIETNQSYSDCGNYRNPCNHRMQHEHRGIITTTNSDCL